MLLCLISYPNDGRKCKYFINGLIRSGMVACVQRINNVKSYYMREGEMKAENEKILLLKLKAENKEKILAYINKNHPYDIPEIIWLQPDDVSDAYLQWVKNS
ncbi:MAG: divalent-cation tolerance protein CutA [Candidatus Peribacteria bacterium]|nr:MAG: divalent-cation tolerance protein CutA [Candidatus Peribacteria bacterium]